MPSPPQRPVATKQKSPVPKMIFIVTGMLLVVVPFCFIVLPHVKDAVSERLAPTVGEPMDPDESYTAPDPQPGLDPETYDKLMRLAQETRDRATQSADTYGPDSKRYRKLSTLKDETPKNGIPDLLEDLWDKVLTDKNDKSAFVSSLLGDTRAKQLIRKKKYDPSNPQLETLKGNIGKDWDIEMLQSWITGNVYSYESKNFKPDYIDPDRYY